MAALMALGSIVLILLVLVDAFETMLLPRRVRRQFRFARLFYVYSWAPWAAVARLIRSEKRRNTLPEPVRAAVDPRSHRDLGGRC